MSHYFTKNPVEVVSNKKAIHFIISGREYHFLSDHGVFSKQGLDFGTRLLLESITLEPGQRVLDLGCGYGPIGIVLAQRDHAEVVMSDVNQRALELTRLNAKNQNVSVRTIESNGFEHIDGLFDWIVTNPPIRAGKHVIYEMFRQSQHYLKPNGRLVLVIRKDQGASSAKTELETSFSQVSTLAKKSGYFVFECRI